MRLETYAHKKYLFQFTWRHKSDLDSVLNTCIQRTYTRTLCYVHSVWLSLVADIVSGNIINYILWKPNAIASLNRASSHYFSAALSLFAFMKAIPWVLMWVLRFPSVSNNLPHTLHLVFGVPSSFSSATSSWFSLWFSSSSLPRPLYRPSPCGSFSRWTIKRWRASERWEV